MAGMEPARRGPARRRDTHPAARRRLPRADAAVLSQLLHDFSPERCRALLSRVADALPSGAPLMLLEIMPDERRTGPVNAVAFAVAMIIYTQGGDAHTEPQYRAWLEEAGFSEVSVRPTGGRMVTTLIEARKR